MQKEKKKIKKRIMWNMKIKCMCDNAQTRYICLVNNKNEGG